MVGKRGRGAPRGTVNNPAGKNQFEGDRGAVISFRLPIDLDTKFRAKIADQGMNKTAALIELVRNWVDGSPHP
jgi:hypothetical protein